MGYGEAMTTEPTGPERLPVRDFVPSLVERDARELLAGSGQPVPDGVGADDRDGPHGG